MLERKNLEITVQEIELFLYQPDSRVILPNKNYSNISLLKILFKRKSLQK